MRNINISSLKILVIFMIITPKYTSAQDAASMASRARINLYQNWNFDSSEYYWNKIIDKESTPAFAYADYGWYLMIYDDRLDEGLSYIRKSVDLDPENKVLLTWYGWALLTKDVSEAKKWIDKVLAMDPNFAEALQVSALIAVRMNENDKAIQWARMAADQDTRFKYLVPLVHAQSGKKEKALETLDKIAIQEEALDFWFLMQIYGWLQMDDQALENMQKAYEAKFPYIPWLELIPGLEHLQKTDTFKSIIASLDLKK